MIDEEEDEETEDQELPMELHDIEFIDIESSIPIVTFEQSTHIPWTDKY